MPYENWHAPELENKKDQERFDRLYGQLFYGPNGTPGGAAAPLKAGVIKSGQIARLGTAGKITALQLSVNSDLKLPVNAEQARLAADILHGLSLSNSGADHKRNLEEQEKEKEKDKRPPAEDRDKKIVGPSETKGEGLILKEIEFKKSDLYLKPNTVSVELDQIKAITFNNGRLEIEIKPDEK